MVRARTAVATVSVVMACAPAATASPSRAATGCRHHTIALRAGQHHICIARPPRHDNEGAEAAAAVRAFARRAHLRGSGHRRPPAWMRSSALAQALRRGTTRAAGLAPEIVAAAQGDGLGVRHASLRSGGWHVTVRVTTRAPGSATAATPQNSGTLVVEQTRSANITRTGLSGTVTETERLSIDRCPSADGEVTGSHSFRRVIALKGPAGHGGTATLTIDDREVAEIRARTTAAGKLTAFDVDERYLNSQQFALLGPAGRVLQTSAPTVSTVELSRHGIPLSGDVTAWVLNHSATVTGALGPSEGHTDAMGNALLRLLLAAQRGQGMLENREESWQGGGCMSVALTSSDLSLTQGTDLSGQAQGSRYLATMPSAQVAHLTATVAPAAGAKLGSGAVNVSTFGSDGSDAGVADPNAAPFTGEPVAFSYTAPEWPTNLPAGDTASSTVSVEVTSHLGRAGADLDISAPPKTTFYYRVTALSGGYSESMSVTGTGPSHNCIDSGSENYQVSLDSGRPSATGPTDGSYFAGGLGIVYAPGSESGTVSYSQTCTGTAPQPACTASFSDHGPHEVDIGSVTASGPNVPVKIAVLQHADWTSQPCDTPYGYSNGDTVQYMDAGTVPLMTLEGDKAFTVTGSDTSSDGEGHTFTRSLTVTLQPTDSGGTPLR